MDIAREREQRECFRNILLDIAKSQEMLQDDSCRLEIYDRLESLYDASSPGERFRHFYSDIFSVLSQIKQNPSLGDINILGQNLNELRDGYKPQNRASDNRLIDVSDAIKKLYDHVNLEVTRMSYSDAGDEKVSGEKAILDLKEKINELQSRIEDGQRKLSKFDEIKRKIAEVEGMLSSSQREYVAILGIFAAVVLAFTGGIAFSTSVLNNIAEASIYRTAVIALIIGLVLVNVLFSLFYYLGKIIGKEQGIRPLFLSNLIFLALIGLVLVSWYWGFVEIRNANIL